MVRNMTSNFINIYIHKEPFDYLKMPLPSCRKNHIKTVDLLEQSYSVLIWRLLDTVVSRDFKVTLNSLHPKKLETGRWLFDKYFISLSHSRGFYAIAISSQPIGIDVQKDVEALAHPKRWSKDEKGVLEKSWTEAYIALWTRKEALYKYLDPGIKFLGNEKKIDTSPYKQYFKTWLYNGNPFAGVSICSKLINDGEKYDFFFDTNLPLEHITEIDEDKVFNRKKLIGATITHFKYKT